ncbi:hypothetical protein [Streptomyces sp. NPDC002550]
MTKSWMMTELFRRAHGHGCAVEAACAVPDAAAATGRKRPWATVRAWKAPAFRVLEKPGFGVTGAEPTTAVGRYGSPARCRDEQEPYNP